MDEIQPGELTAIPQAITIPMQRNRQKRIIATIKRNASTITS